MPKPSKDSAISVVLPVVHKHEWQLVMTRYCVEMMRTCTERKFQLVIVETGKSMRACKDLADRYIHVREFGNPTKDVNLGVDAAQGEYVVYTGNDILMKPGWLEALLEPFEKFDDCGMSTLAVGEPGAMVGSPEPRGIVEGMYGPLTMFAKGWRYDESFRSMRADDDLAMRICNAGLRCYRNNRVSVFHLMRQTFDTVFSQKERDEIRAEADALFRRRYQDSPLWMANMILAGHVIYGREHENR